MKRVHTESPVCHKAQRLHNVLQDLSDQLDRVDDQDLVVAFETIRVASKQENITIREVDNFFDGVALTDPKRVCYYKVALVVIRNHYAAGKERVAFEEYMKVKYAMPLLAVGDSSM